ncbi:MAG: cyclic nucleotide-binding domain-containing protein [Pikeienuella sp.]
MEFFAWLGLDSSVLLHVAMLGYVAGFLFREQIVLRILVLIGTGLYIAYYYVHPAEPLWEAMFASVLIGLANLLGLGHLLISRVMFGMSDEEKLIYAKLPGLEPGHFRALMRIGKIGTLKRAALLTKEGTQPDKLYFTCSGEFAAEKGERRFMIPAGVFIGEVSFVLGSAASATLAAPAGSRIAVWDVEDLKQAFAQRPRLKEAIEALLARDLAAKVAEGVMLSNRRHVPDDTELYGWAKAV